MTAQPIRRTVAVLAAATLTATLAATALAAEVEAAKPKPKCQGKVATIVGTQQADILKGTAKRDVIVAKGGNDRIYAKGGSDLVCAGPGDDVVFGGPGADTIWGQFGNDTLNGNVGPDFIAGQVGDDTINGGIGVDTCFQGTGSGSVVRCERPEPPVAPTPPPPPPDTDGDGVPDASDACPSRGDQGYGLDVDGCPFPSVTVTYFSTTVGNFQWVTTWKGTEPGSRVEVALRTPGTAYVVHTPTYYGNSTGSGSMATAFEPALACSTGYATAEITATEAGGTEKTFPGPLPDSSVCP